MRECSYPLSFLENAIWLLCIRKTGKDAERIPCAVSYREQNINSIIFCKRKKNEFSKKSSRPALISKPYLLG